MATLIGREKERRELMSLYDSNRAEFVAIYGRRRVGKTFLVDETFKGKITFRHSGLSPVEHSAANMLKAQLANFHQSLMMQGMAPCGRPKSWLEAFFNLERHLTAIDNGARQLVFIDELPWLDTPRSGFVTALEAFWNGWASHRDNIMLVVCGSATSWIEDKLINNHGGLYGRLTGEIKLSPFTLHECELFFQSRGISLSRYDIAQSYMAMGGIPYYLGYVERGMSATQAIDTLFFGNKARLASEYDRLFSSVFTRPERVKDVIGVLANRHSGYTAPEIAAQTGLSGVNDLYDTLRALLAGDFVETFVPFGKSKRAVHYRLIDPFCIFYHAHVKANGHEQGYWLKRLQSPTVASWRGIAFEELCRQHVRQIKRSLGVEGVASQQSSVIIVGDKEHDGVQIDLLVQRADNIANLCEMKFYAEEFAVDKAYYRRLLRAQQTISEQLPRRVAVHLTLVTTFGLTYNEYFGAFQRVVTLDDLFAP